MNKNQFKPGDKVKFKDGDPRIFTIYEIYTPIKISLGLYEYPDIEQNWLTDIRNIKKAHDKKKLQRNSIKHKPSNTRKHTKPDKQAKSNKPTKKNIPSRQSKLQSGKIRKGVRKNK